MKVRCVQAERNAAAELNWLLLDQVITDFTTNFDSKRQPWFDLKVMVSVKATDEFTIARVRCRVQIALAPYLTGVAVTVTGGRPARTFRVSDDGCGSPELDEWQ